MTRWNLISEYGSGDVLEVVEGSYDKANKRKIELKEIYGYDVIMSPTI